MDIGIRRRLDDLGRIVIPKEMRNTLDIKIGDLLDIKCKDDVIMLKKIDNTENKKVDIIKVKEVIKNVFSIDENSKEYKMLDELLSN